MRTICELSTLPGTVYVSLPTRQAQALFLRDALDQGLTFADGQAPTNQAPWNFYRLDPGPTICYAGRGFCAVQKMALVCRGAGGGGKPAPACGEEQNERQHSRQNFFCHTKFLHCPYAAMIRFWGGSFKI